MDDQEISTYQAGSEDTVKHDCPCSLMRIGIKKEHIDDRGQDGDVVPEAGLRCIAGDRAPALPN